MAAFHRLTDQGLVARRREALEQVGAAMRRFQRLLVAVAALCCALSGTLALWSVSTYEKVEPPILSSPAWPVFVPGFHMPVQADACPAHLAGDPSDPCKRAYLGDEAANAALRALWGQGPGPSLDTP